MLVLLLAAVSACGAQVTRGAGDSPVPAEPSVSADPLVHDDVELVGRGLVMDTGARVEFCLGPVMESWPPQCRGIPLLGWDWTKVEPDGSGNGMRWGDYRLIGRYDGRTFTVTRPPEPGSTAPDVPLGRLPGLECPPPSGNLAGELDPETAQQACLDKTFPSPEELQSVQEQAMRELHGVSGFTGVDGVHVDVLYDDGTLQLYADQRFGDGVVHVTSLLTPYDG